jgi:CRP/FNR family transcriptional regulator
MPAPSETDNSHRSARFLVNISWSVAAFLLNLVQRLHARGFSQSELILRMTREEIGSYLGLKLETVSRTFSKFVDDGIVEVKQRHVRILNTEALSQIVNHEECH